MRRADTSAVLGLLLLGAAACSSTGPSSMGKVVFRIATNAAAPTNGPAAADVIVDKGTDHLVITEVQLVARKIRLERDNACPEEVEDDTPSADGGDGGHEADEENENEQDEDCPVLKLGPLLLNPPLNDGTQTTFEVDVPAGIYDEINLQIHRPKGSKDAAFLALHPEFEDVSIQVKGTFNGTPFTFKTGLTAEEEIKLDPPVVVAAGGTTSFTLLLDVRGWFLNLGGTALVDPANAANQSQIEHNIRSSFHAFEDEDGDGHEDHDDH